MDSKLTLEKTMACQGEAVREQQCVLKGNRVEPSHTPHTKHAKENLQIRSTYQRNVCILGEIHHIHCPTRDVKCQRCVKMDHFAAVCLTKPLDTIEEDDTQTEPTQDTLTSDSFFLDTVEELQNSGY